MSKTFSVKLNTKQFKKKISRFKRRIMPNAVESGISLALIELLRSSIFDPPTVPLDEGTLRGSGSIFVKPVTEDLKPGYGFKFVKDSTGMGGATEGTPSRDHSEVWDGKSLGGVIGFNTPYAAYTHEGIRLDGTHKIVNWTEPGSGPKFLQSKMASKKRDAIMEIIANEIANKL